MPDVSILIVNWNTRARIRQCLRALASLPPSLDCEIVVIDNGSTDGSVDVVRTEFPSVRLLGNAHNLGFAKAVNRGLRETRSPFVLLLNSDAQPEAGAVDALVAALRARPDAAAAGAQLVGRGGRPQHSFDAFPSLAAELLNKSLLRRLAPSFYPSRLQERTEPFEVDSLIGACALIRRDALESVGPLDERYFVFYEETDWCLRARREGWRILLVPGARATHLQGETKAHHPGRARVESWRSKYAYFDKHRGRGVRRFLQGWATLRLSLQCAARVGACVLTLGLSEGLRRRAAADVWLWLWHAAGAPPFMGFAPAGSTPGYLRTRHPGGVRWVPRDRVLSLQGSPLLRLDEFLDTPAACLLKEGRAKSHHRVTLASAGAHRDWHIKVYKRRGLWGAVKDFFRGPKALRELARMCVADRRGVPASLPAVAGAWTSGPRAGESYLAFATLDGWTLLDARLREGGGAGSGGGASLRERREVIRAFGRFARRVYDAGIYQDDFNPTNVYSRRGEEGPVEFWLVDFERVRIMPVVPERMRLWTIAKMGRIPEWGGRTDAARFMMGMVPDRRKRLEFWAGLRAAARRVMQQDRRKGVGIHAPSHGAF